MRKVLFSLIGIIVLIPIGLCSRQISWVPEETGDALWAMMVFCIWRIILVKQELRLIAIVSLTHSFLVEFSQLIRWPWLVSFRNTFIGHMMLGQGFLWTDLLAYAIGIAIIYWVFKGLKRFSFKVDQRTVTWSCAWNCPKSADSRFVFEDNIWKSTTNPCLNIRAQARLYL